MHIPLPVDSKGKEINHQNVNIPDRKRQNEQVKEEIMPKHPRSLAERRQQFVRCGRSVDPDPLISLEDVAQHQKQ